MRIRPTGISRFEPLIRSAAFMPLQRELAWRHGSGINAALQRGFMGRRPMIFRLRSPHPNPPCPALAVIPVGRGEGNKTHVGLIPR